MFLITALIGCGMLIERSWSKWNRSPVIVSFDNELSPIWKIPFPAITICPETKAKMDIFNFTKAYHTNNLSSVEYVLVLVDSY